MIKKQVKCPRCGQVLLRLYSNAVIDVTCKCGYCVDVKHMENNERKPKKNAR